MNERIRELAEQARGWAEVSYKKQNDQFTSHWDNPIGYTPSQFFEQKFAELIVKECMLICGAIQGAGEVRNMHDFASGAAQCRAIIKRDFGVEE